MTQTWTIIFGFFGIFVTKLVNIKDNFALLVINKNVASISNRHREGVISTNKFAKHWRIIDWNLLYNSNLHALDCNSCQIFIEHVQISVLQQRHPAATEAFPLPQCHQNHTQRSESIHLKLFLVWYFAFNISSRADFKKHGNLFSFNFAKMFPFCCRRHHLVTMPLL